MSNELSEQIPQNEQLIRDELKQWINESLFRTDGHINSKRLDDKYLIKHFQQQYEQLLKQTEFLLNTVQNSERVYCILNNITYRPKCKQCENLVNFQRISRGYYTYCSSKCNVNDPEIIQKREETSMKNYGVRNPAQSKVVQDRMAETNMKRYKSKSPAGNDEIMSKIKKTNKKRHGKEHYFNTQLFKVQCAKTLMDKYQVTNPSQMIGHQEKVRKTSIEKYDCEHFAQSPLVRNKAIETNNKKYDCDNPFQNEDIKNKMKETCIANCGFEFHKQQHTIHREDITKEFIESNFVDNDKKLLLNECCKYFNYSQSHVYKVLHSLGVDYKQSRSHNEEYIFKIVQQYYPSTIPNPRNIIHPFELDIYIPELKLAIEYDGLYWHSTKVGKTKEYHLDKTKLCEEQGIELIHIFENEWKGNQDKLLSLLKNKIKQHEQTYNIDYCIIKEVNNKTKDNFFNTNHIENTSASNLNIGLYCNKELISLMSFDDQILVRTCNKLNTSITGGFEKLFNYYINKTKSTNIKTSIDRRYDNGKELIIDHGFIITSYSEPDEHILKRHTLYDCGKINLEFSK